MSKLWSNIKRAHVLRAIQLFDRKAGNYPEARNTFLIHNGKKYPAKHIRGLAYQIVNKKEISKYDYSGGKETANFFQQLDFEVEYKKEILKPKTKGNETLAIEKSVWLLKTSNNLNPVAQKNAIQKLLQEYFGVIETEKKFDWLKTPVPNKLPSEYRQIFEALITYRNHNSFLNPNYQLLCDIVLDDQKLIIEYDENQHFSKARQITLENYPEHISLGYSKSDWVDACIKINAKDNSPIDRDEKRAFYDTVRDIEAQRHGYTLIRIKYGDFDWENENAIEHLKAIIAKNCNSMKTKDSKHKIARLILTGKQYDKNGRPKYKEIKKVITNFLAKTDNKKRFEFILTPGGFLNFELPCKLQYDVDLKKAEKIKVPIFYSRAEQVINDFFKDLSEKTVKQLNDTADYFTIGIDGFNPKNNQSIEIVAVYDLREQKVIHWTGKFYPTEGQKRNLVKINDLNTHFIQLNNQKIVILGCHDLNVFSPRGQAVAKPNSWKKKTSNKFRKDCKQFCPSIILHHPHTTDTPNIWNLPWRTVEKELPNVSHFASGIKYYRREGERGDINTVLKKTKKGDVVDYTFD
ncbi:MAG: hypothetical protein KAW47_00055 [Thermoplasmatales archaeon]|nr:hypothetical protein [Thermoplasmatales archaeon]